MKELRIGRRKESLAFGVKWLCEELKTLEQLLKERKEALNETEEKEV